MSVPDGRVHSEGMQRSAGCYAALLQAGCLEIVRSIRRSVTHIIDLRGVLDAEDSLTLDIGEGPPQPLCETGSNP